MTWNQPPPYQPPPLPSTQPGWTRKRVIIPTAVGIFFVGVVIGSAGSPDTAPTGGTVKVAPPVTATVTAKAATTKAEPAPTATKIVTAKPTTVPGDDKAADGEKAKVANFVGMGLQAAQDAAQADGFFLLSSHDSAGASRLQILDRNWKVCSQNVAAGKSVPVDTELDFGAVKLEESCP